MPNPVPPEPEEDPPAVVQFPTPQATPAPAPAAAPAAPAAAPAAPAGAPGVYQPNLAPRTPGPASAGAIQPMPGLPGQTQPDRNTPLQQMPTGPAPAPAPAQTQGVFGVPGAAVGGSAAAPKMAADLQRPGASESMHDFEAQDPNIKGPSDFVGFDRFAGLNDDLMRTIADRNSDTSSAARQTALGFLSDAQNEATAETPVEKTPSYRKYLAAMAKTNDAGQSFNAQTNNPYEDALRGVYAPAQTARNNRLQANAINSGKVSSLNRNRFNTTQKEQADAAAAAAVAKQAADKKTADAARRSAALETASASREARDEQTAPAKKRTGKTKDDEYTTRDRRDVYDGGGDY